MPPGRVSFDMKGTALSGQPPPFRRQLRRASSIFLALIAAVATLIAVPGTAAAYFEQVGVPAGAPCPDVLVIGARGSGQPPQAPSAVEPVEYELDQFNGMGDVNYDVYRWLHENLPDLRIAYEGVQYAAGPVFSFTDQSAASTFSSYICNALAGGDWMAAEVGLIDARCKHNTKFVLSGYSQ